MLSRPATERRCSRSTAPLRAHAAWAGACPVFQRRTPTIGSLGITNASQIGVLFNATGPMANSVSVLDVTLKFLGSDGSFLGAIDGQQTFADSNPGNGVAGFTFVVDQAQQACVNGLLAYGPTTTMALEASIGMFSGGPESFLVYNLAAVNPIPEPETYALLLAGLGVLGFVARRRQPG